MKLVDDETNLMSSEELSKIKGQLKSEKHACFHVRLEQSFWDLEINMEEVTKPKNPGRVAAGKKTAEFNRERKEDLLNQKTVPSDTDSGNEVGT